MDCRLPVEVLDIVINAFTDWPTFRPQLGVRMSMREIRSHSLTCRRWAARCRFWAFASLTLDSREAFDTFLHLIDTAEDMGDIPSLAECIQELDVIHSGPWAVPWFHHILKELQHRDIDLDSDRISLEIREAYVPESGDADSESPVTPKTNYAPRSLSTFLPRTMPRALFSHSILHLTELRFRSVADLLRLIDDQADLSIMNWTHIAFDQGVVVPPPRPRKRRAWLGMETITTSKWTDIDMELQIMLLVAAEKVPMSLLLPLDNWTQMAKAARTFVFPSTAKISLSLRGQDLGINFEVVTSGQLVSTHLLEFHILPPPHATKQTLPHIPTIQLGIRPQAALEDLKRVDWEAFEDAIHVINPHPHLEMIVEHRGESDHAIHLFKWFLDVVSKNTTLQNMRDAGQLRLQFAVAEHREQWNLWTYTDSAKVMSAQSEYTVDGRKLVLNPPDVFGLMLCEEGGREQYLRNVACALKSVAVTQKAHPIEDRIVDKTLDTIST